MKILGIISVCCTSVRFPGKPLIQQVLLILAIGFAAGCSHPAPLSNSEAREYGMEMLARHVPPQDLPKYNLSLYQTHVKAKIREAIRAARKRHPYFTKQGTVVLTFKLYPNGRISDLKAAPETNHTEVVDPKLVEIAMHGVYQASPFEPWPEGTKSLMPEGFMPWTHTINFVTLELDPIDRPVPRIMPPDPLRYRDQYYYLKRR